MREQDIYISLVTLRNICELTDTLVIPVEFVK